MLLIIKGNEDKKRWERNCAYLIFCSMTDSKNRPSAKELLPLRFDDELKDPTPEQSLEEWYEEQSKFMADYKWN